MENEEQPRKEFGLVNPIRVNLDFDGITESLKKAVQDAVTAICDTSSESQKRDDNMNEQSRDEMHERIMLASDRKILRRQVELLAEYSHLPIGTSRIPECSCAMARLYPELVKAEHLSVLRGAALLAVFLGLIYGLNVKLVKFFKRE